MDVWKWKGLHVMEKIPSCVKAMVVVYTNFNSNLMCLSVTNIMAAFFVNREIDGYAKLRSTWKQILMLGIFLCAFTWLVSPGSVSTRQCLLGIMSVVWYPQQMST